MKKKNLIMKKISEKRKIKNLFCFLFALLFLFVSWITINQNIISNRYCAQEIKILEMLSTREKNEDGIGEDIDFKAFFLRDTNNDDIAEEFKEVDRQIKTTDTLFVDLNIKTQGYLKDGVITLESGGNFKWYTTLVESKIIKGNYIGETRQVKLQEKLANGTQVLLYGTVKDNIGNNIYNYDKKSIMKLTGTFVDEEGNETEIERIQEVKVNWHGETSTIITNKTQSQELSLSDESETFNASFRIDVAETKNQLLLQRQETVTQIPEVNGYKPISVDVASSNTEHTYDEETGLLTIYRDAEVDADGNIIKSIARANSYYIDVKYPIEAFIESGKDTITIEIPTTATNYGFNNDNYMNPHISSDSAVVQVSYYKKISSPVGEIQVPSFYVYTYIGTYSKGNYRVSKEGPTNLYNNNLNIEKDTYSVAWEAHIRNRHNINSITLEEKQTDRFNGTESMYDYATTTGIYFGKADEIIGSKGKIDLYNAEDGSLIKTFNCSEVKHYQKNNPYKINAKSIKIETTAPIANGVLYVYQIKEIDDEKITNKTETTGYTKEEFDELEKIYTYLKGTIKGYKINNLAEDEDTYSLEKRNYALYEIPYSVATLGIDWEGFSNQTVNNKALSIETSSANSFERIWKDGIFVLELPEEIINVEIKNVECENRDLKIVSSVVYEEDGKKFIRIDTKNDEELVYKIKINADFYANPLIGDVSTKIKLYAFNKNYDNYYTKTADVYDIDGDSLKTDNVGYSETDIKIRAPQGLITTEYISNYDDDGSITIAPNIAEIEREDEKRKATINISVANNYVNIIDEVKITGKTPFAGNTYVLNEQSQELGSDYTAFMDGPIKIPEALKDYAIVYYTEVEKPTIDITDDSNQWTTEVNDWSKVRNYLIDLGNYEFVKKSHETFSYDVYVPEKQGYNSVSYSAHAVYYSLNTDDAGRYRTATQPNKTGIQVIGKYNLEIVKNKADQKNILIPGATYSLTTVIDDKEVSQVATTNLEGKLLFKKVYIGREYTLREIATPSNYELNEKDISFTTRLNETEDNLIIETLENNFSEEPNVTIDENGNYFIKTKVEDEAKLTLRLETYNKEREKIKNVKYNLTKDSNTTTYTNEITEIEIPNYSINQEASLKQTKADEYYLKQGDWPFTIVRDEETRKLKVVSEDEEIRNAIVEENIEGQSIVTIKIVNEKIPTYNLKIVKIKEVTNSEDELEFLKDVQFRLYSEDVKESKYPVIESENGITIDGMYTYVEGKYVSGKYILQEVKAPSGYCNNIEEIKFFVTRNEEDQLEIIIENKDELISVYKTEIEDNTIKMYIQDKPLFKLEKRDLDTEELLPDAEFVIYELDEEFNEIDFAKDINGNYLGVQNESGDYVFKTNEDGEIILPLKAGLYLLKEISYPEGYQEKETKKIFKIAGTDDIIEAEIEDGESEINIQYIEDLVELSNNTNSGKNYSRKLVKLTRDLDFNEASSYKTNEINQSLITGEGFTPIGKDSDNAFNGIFEGNNYTIKNLYQNVEDESVEYAGLFGNINNARIYNLNVTGNINNESKTYAIGGVIGQAEDSEIYKCNSSCNIVDSAKTSRIIGGIVGYAKETTIDFCTNCGEIRKNINNPTYIGGITGQKNSGKVRVCSNTGNIICTSEDNNENNSESKIYVGGLIGENTGAINKSFNTGNITVNNNNQVKKYQQYVGGISGNSYGEMYEVYNLGNIFNEENVKNVGYEGGLVGLYTGFNDLATSVAINKCYNKGIINGTNYVGGILGRYSGSLQYKYSPIHNSYNLGEIAGKYAAGIVGTFENRSPKYKIKNCYNCGKITGETCAGEILAEQNVPDSYKPIVTVEACYYLENKIECETINTKGTSMTEEAMKDVEFVNTLNSVSSVWKMDSLNENNGYPALDILEATGEVEYVSGTVEINYIEDLVKLSNDINGGVSYKSAKVVLKRDLDFKDANSYENNEIDAALISETGFNPIGHDVNYAFDGIFDGNGKTIKNLYLNKYAGSYGTLYTYVGLFGYTNNAIIENLKLEDVDISGETPQASNYKTYVAAVACCAQDSQIKNCSTTGIIRTGNARAGIVYNAKNTTIEDCVNNINFLGGNDAYTTGTYAAGGICYYLTDGTIARCSNKGHVDASSNSAGILYSGTRSNIYYCYNVGQVKGVGIANSIADGKIAACYNTGEVLIAGIANNISGTSSIYKCYNSGNIESETSPTQVGGIVRYINGTGTVSNCYNTGNIINRNTSANYSGGIVGYAYGTAIVNNCYNAGNITNTASSNSYVGGIIGYSNKKSIVTDCYNTGNLEIGETNNVAGIIGYSIAADEIINTYNIGNIGISNEKYDSLGGGINAANVANTIQNSYYMKGVLNDIERKSTKDGIETESSEMITKEFYDTLNVNNVWKYNKDSYPTLRNMDLVLGDIPEVTELRVDNTIKKFNITTEIINENCGTVEAKEEVVEYGKNNVKDYVITPNDGYIIYSIKINGEELTLTDDDKKSYTISKDYFNYVTEDKHIVITFLAEDESFELLKIDEDDESKKLKDAKYIITTDPRENNIELGTASYVGAEYRMINEDKKTENVLSEMKETETVYTFTKNSDGSIVSNNAAAGKVACVYYEIDLTDREGNYFVGINYSVDAYYYYSESNETYTYYGYGYGMITTEPRADNTKVPSSSERFMYAPGRSTKSVTSNVLEGGKKYYLYLGYKPYSTRNGFTDTIKIKNVGVYETSKFEMKKIDGKYVSTNQKMANSISSLCIPIDLRETTGQYDLKINAEISSQQGGDFGSAIVNQKESLPTNTTGRFIYISGEKAAEDYTTTLDGGNLYYLHLQYSKGQYTDSGSDTFTINSIDLSLNRTGYIYEELTTNELGKIKLDVQGDKTLYITEIEAPKDYLLDVNTYIYKMTPGQSNNSLTLTNKAKPKLIVHHYYEGTENKVAEDEIYVGNKGEEYNTAPKIDLNKLNLIKDENGEYVLPNNKNGAYDENNVEVTYYYKAEPIKLTIHHCYEGTENKIVEDEIIETPVNVTFGGDELYNISTETTYEIKNNNNYKEIINENDFVDVKTSLDREITIEDTIEYTQDEEITYYYKLKEYEYTINYFYNGIKDEEATVVKKAIKGTVLNSYEDKQKDDYQFVKAKSLDENGEETELPLTIKEDTSRNVINVYYDKLYKVTTDVKKHTEKDSNGENISVKGGSISGEYETSYEEILFENSNKKAIAIKPDDGYKISYIKINGSNIEIQKPDEEFTLPAGYFENVKENKHVEVCFENKEKSTIRVHHYLKENGEYTTKQVAEDEIYQDEKGKHYETTFHADLEGLQIEKDGEGNANIPENATGEYRENDIEINYYYEPRKIGLIIHHYLEGTKTKLVEDEILAVSLEVYLDEDGKYKVDDKSKYELKSNTNYKDLIENYDLTSVFTLVKENAEISDTIEFSEDTEIAYFYKEIERYDYTVHYFYNGNEDVSKIETATARYEDEIKTYKDKAEGYILVVAKALNENGEEKQEVLEASPLVIGKDTNKNRINVYYKSQYKITARVKDNKGGTVENDNNENVNETVSYGENSKDKIIITPESEYDIANIVINTYDEEGNKIAEETLNIDSFENSNGIVTIPEGYFENMTANKEVVVEFKKKSKVTVKYLEKNTKEVKSEQIVIEGHEGDEYNVSAAVVEGYRLGRVETNDGSLSSVTYENNDKFDLSNENKMTEDDTIVIFWYEKIPEGTITVKHIEIDANNVETEITQENYTGKLGEIQETTRKEFVDNIAGRKYIAVNGPSSDKENIVVIEKEDNKYDVTYVENATGTIDSVEVRYYYQRNYIITAKVEEHVEKINDTETYVKGGKITEKDEIVYTSEQLVKSSSNAKEIIIEPDENYRIKFVKVNGKIIFLEDLINEDIVTIPVGYFSNISEDKEIEVEFERIPAKVIVKHLIDQDEEQRISEDEIKLGVVGEKYNTEPKEIEGYKLVESKLPINNVGVMAKEDIEVIYYYKKENQEAKDAKVIVRYIDIETNQELVKSYIKKGIIGEEYQVERITIPGYEQAGDDPNNSIGKMTEEDIVVNYYYKKINVTEDKPEEKTEDGEEQEDKPEEEGKDNNEENKENEPAIIDDEEIPPFPGLPQTEDNIMSSIFTLIGSSLSLMLVTAAGKRGKRNKRHSKK